MVDKKLSEFSEASEEEASYFPVIDSSTKNRKLPARFLTGIKTNCITSVPQDITLELNNGTLTLKAGSKVYVPNGAGVFDVVNVSSDITLTQQLEQNIDCLLFVYGGTTLNVMPVNRCSSGASDSISGSDHFYYNTTNNTVRFIESSGTARATPISLPIAIVKMSGNGAIVSSIDQVFNGIGYIGNTFFAYPGVKGLIPNGRNADGTLKNLTLTTQNVYVRQNTSSNTSSVLTIGSTGFGFVSTYVYNEEENLQYSGTTSFTNGLGYARFTITDSKITSFIPKMPFHAVDYSDLFDGNHTYSGDNTYTGNNVFKHPYIRNPYLTKGTAPSSNAYYGLYFTDKNGNNWGANQLGQVQMQCLASGDNALQIAAIKQNANSTDTAALGVIITQNGVKYAYCPTPSSATDNSTKIATTAFIANKFQVVSTLPANPVSGVYYFVTE